MRFTKEDELIAEFMGGIKTKQDSRFGGIHGFMFTWLTHPNPWKTITDDTHFVTEAQYKTSWDWLMKVVKKITELEEPPKESSGWYAYFSIENTLFDVDIDRTYETVVEYIKWYNNGKEV